ncbi:MAG: amidohydrolase [Tindallia sp. MSAO_Bac2]|nr:MAG: amidohydrolase [Tindallia sp. MSAO_Bac2]
MDRILFNGKVVTMDAEQPDASAVAIKDGRVAAVGSDNEMIKLKNDKTEMMDLQGKTVVPGFNDSHLHLLDYARRKEHINLSHCRNMDELLDTIRRGIEKKNPRPEDLIIASEWNDSQLREKRFPERADLDLIDVPNPIIAIRRCVNIAVLNCRAVEMFSDALTYANSLKEDNAEVDEQGNFTGLLKGNVAISEVTPLLRKDQIKNALENAFEDCLKCGLTSVQTDDVTAAELEDVLEVYEEMDRKGELPIRINAQLRMPTLDIFQKFLDKGRKTGDGSPFFKIGPLKLVADGTLGARTAAMMEPYADAAETEGLMLYSREDIDEFVETSLKSGMQIAIHTIGDRAMKMVLDAYRAGLEKYPTADPRFRIIHGQITTEELIRQYKDLKVIADVQPLFISSDQPIVESRVGKEKAKYTYNWKTFVEKGIPLGASSDAPVESFNPLEGIYAFVTRKTMEGAPEEGWLPEQRLTVEEAVYAFTMGSAYCSFEEKMKGSITPGKVADLVVLSEDIFSIEPENIKDVVVEKTMVGGKILYSA